MEKENNKKKSKVTIFAANIANSAAPKHNSKKVARLRPGIGGKYFHSFPQKNLWPEKTETDY